MTFQSKATVDKTASVLAPNKDLATSNPCIGHLHTALIKKMSVAPTNAFP